MREYYEWIDSVKGWAILLIMCIHLENWTGLFENNLLILKIIHKGTLGVELTYLVNAFLLAHKYAGMRGGGGVFLNSTIRILPMYFLALGIFVAYSCLFLISDTPTVLNVLSHFILVSFVNPYWWATFPGTGYMGVLILCWLILPLYMRYVDSFGKAIQAMCFTLIASVLVSAIVGKHSFISDTSLWGDWISYIFRGFESFSVGVLLYYFFQKIDLKDFITKKDAIFFVSLDLFYLFMLCFFDVQLNFFYLIAVIPFIVILNYFPVKVFVNLIVGVLGKYSFGLYFSHILLYFVLCKYISNVVLLWAADIILSFFTAWLLCNVYEKNAVKLLKRLVRVK